MNRVTLLKSGSATLVEKKSEFIGYACPVKDEDEAIEFVKSIKKKHSDARHNVYAYMIGQNIARYSDDGEPQGTGGIPVLDVIRKSGFTDAVIVVTRYFGGILLGAGGLVRAYSAAAKMAVDDAGIVTYIGKTKTLTRWILVGKLMSLLFNMLSRLVIASLPRSKYLLIS